MKPGIFAVGLIAFSLTMMPGRGLAQEQSIFATLQVAGAPSAYVSGTLSESSDKAFFPVSVSAGTITLAGKTWVMQTSSGPVKSGSLVTLKSGGSFLSCCNSGKLTSSATAGARERFTVTYYTADQVRTENARRAADQDRRAKAGFNSEVN